MNRTTNVMIAAWVRRPDTQFSLIVCVLPFSFQRTTLAMRPLAGQGQAPVRDFAKGYISYDGF
jgi:hypothetical protein